MPSCTLKILDEVNVKFDSLDVATRRKCSNKLKFKLPYAHMLPSVRLGRWDGTKEFFSVGGATQINLLDRILPIIEEAGYDINIQDFRTTYDFSFPHIDKDLFAHINWPATHNTHANLPIELEPHQVASVNTFIDNLQCIQRIATGAGKTLMTGALSKVAEKYGRTIVIVPSKQLVEQTLADYKMLGLDAGVYYGDEKNWGKTHTICTWQSLDVLLKKTKDGVTEEDKDILTFIDGVVAVIGDECHGVKGDQLFKLLTRVLHRVPIRWGLTGTIPKEEFDQISLLAAIGVIINGVSSAELQDLGFLSTCNIQVIQTQETIKFNSFPDETHYLTTNPQRLKWLAKLTQGIAETGNTLVLVNRIETGKELEKLIPGSVFVSGNMKTKNRKEEYDLVATNNNLTIIATFGVASTGINVPRIYNLITFESGKSFIKTIQSIGRVLRKATDKDSAMIYDICSATKYSKRHLTDRKKWYRESQYPFTITKTIIS